MKMVKEIMLALVGFALIYLLTSFIQWEANPKNWDISIRFFTAGSGLVVLIILVGISYRKE